MSDELQTMADDLAAEAQEVMAELVRLSEIADSQRQAGDVSDLVGTQDAIIRLDIELLSCTQQIGEMQYEALQRAVAQRDAALAEVAKLQAEVAKMRGLLPTWERGSHVRSLWSIRIAGRKLQVWPSAQIWFWAFSDGRQQPAISRDAAMRAAEAAAGLPQCEVVE